MRVIRAFAVGLGTGYLIWSGTGRKLIDKLVASRDRARASKPARTNRASTEAAIMPVDLAVPTAGADPLLGTSGAATESDRTTRRAG